MKYTYDVDCTLTAAERAAWEAYQQRIARYSADVAESEEVRAPWLGLLMLGAASGALIGWALAMAWMTGFGG